MEICVEREAICVRNLHIMQTSVSRRVVGPCAPETFTFDSSCKLPIQRMQRNLCEIENFGWLTLQQHMTTLQGPEYAATKISVTLYPLR